MGVRVMKASRVAFSERKEIWDNRIKSKETVERVIIEIQESQLS